MQHQYASLWVSAEGEPGPTNDDLQQHISAATAGGGSVIMEPMELPGFGSIAVIADPEGNPLGIWKR